MKIVNKTGMGNDTKILINGKDVTEDLCVSNIELSISAGGAVTATLTCLVDELGVEVNNSRVAREEEPLDKDPTANIENNAKHIEAIVQRSYDERFRQGGPTVVGVDFARDTSRDLLLLVSKDSKD